MTYDSNTQTSSTTFAIAKWAGLAAMIGILTASNVLACLDDSISEDRFNEVSMGVTKSLPEGLQSAACNAPCTYHSEATVYQLNHGSVPAGGFQFFPEQLVLKNEGRQPVEYAISYLTMSDEQGVSINGVPVTREQLLAEKNSSIYAADEAQRTEYLRAIREKLGIPDSLTIKTTDENGDAVVNLDDDYGEDVTVVLRKIPQGKPFFLSAVYGSKNESYAHAMPAMKIFDERAGTEKILVGFQSQEGDVVAFDSLDSFDQSLKAVLTFFQKTSIRTIARVNVVEPI